MRTPLQVGALLAALLLTLTGCGSAGLGEDVARVSAGATLEIAQGDTWVPAAIGDAVPNGARVRTGVSEVRLRLSSGEVWLSPKSMARLSRDVVEVERGDVLVAADRDLTSRWGESEVKGKATYRLTLDVMPLLKVYEGDVEVSRLAEERAVPALRQLSLGAPRLAEEPAPIDYDVRDEWDRTLLPAAVAFDAEVEQLARGLDRQYGDQPRDAAFYATYAILDPNTIPILAAASRTKTADDRFGPPSDALVALFVAEAAAGSDAARVAETARAVAEMRAAGARWGAVALEHGVSPVELAQVVDRAQERHLLAVGGAEEGAEPGGAVAAVPGAEPVQAASAAPGPASASAPPVASVGAAVPSAGQQPAASAAGGASGGPAASGGASGGGSAPTRPGSGGGGGAGGGGAGGSGGSGGGTGSGGSGGGGGAGGSGGSGGSGSQPPVVTAPAPAPKPAPAPAPAPKPAPSRPTPTPTPPDDGGESSDPEGEADDLVEDAIGTIGGLL